MRRVRRGDDARHRDAVGEPVVRDGVLQGQKAAFGVLDGVGAEVEVRGERVEEDGHFGGVRREGV